MGRQLRPNTLEFIPLEETSAGVLNGCCRERRQLPNLPVCVSQPNHTAKRSDFPLDSGRSRPVVLATASPLPCTKSRGDLGTANRKRT